MGLGLSQAGEAIAVVHLRPGGVPGDPAGEGLDGAGPRGRIERRGQDDPGEPLERGDIRGREFGAHGALA